MTRLSNMEVSRLGGLLFFFSQEKESVFLLDDNRINEVNLMTGRSKRKNPKLQSVLPNVVVMSSSPNG